MFVRNKIDLEFDIVLCYVIKNHFLKQSTGAE